MWRLGQFSLAELLLHMQEDAGSIPRNKDKLN
jgi:hypothetical protein